MGYTKASRSPTRSQDPRLAQCILQILLLADFSCMVSYSYFQLLLVALSYP